MVFECRVQDLVTNAAWNGLSTCPRKDSEVGDEVPQDQGLRGTILDNLEANELCCLYMSKVRRAKDSREQDDSDRRCTSSVPLGRLHKGPSMFNEESEMQVGEAHGKLGTKFGWELGPELRLTNVTLGMTADIRS